MKQNPIPLLAVFSLLLAVSNFCHGQDRNDPRLPVRIVPLDGISKHFKESEIVVLGLVDSFDAGVVDGDPNDISTPAKKLNHQLLKLRELGGSAIPDVEEKVPYSDRISIFVAESNKGRDPNAIEAHQHVAKTLYASLEAPPYVMSNPMFFLIHRGKLLRCYGSYHEPGYEGLGLRNLVVALLFPQANDNPEAPEILMMNALALRKEKGNEQAIDYLSERLLDPRGFSRYSEAYSYFWTEAQVRSGSIDAVWASMIFDLLFTVSQRKGYFGNSMQVVSNLCSNLSACGRYGRLAEVMAVWENGHKMAGNRMDISSYPDLGPAIPCLPEIRHRGMPITRPSEKPIAPGSNANGFHVNDAGAISIHSSLLHASGRWRESLEYTVWIRDWATSDKTKQPIGEFATSWYAATSKLIASLEFMGFREEALAMVEEGLAAPHGQTYHGRWKIFLAADHLHTLMLLDRAPSDIIGQYGSLIEKARHNGHINKGGVWSIQVRLAEALIKSGQVNEGEKLFDQLVTEGSLDARRLRLTHWIKSGRVDGVEEELQSLLRFSRETGQKLSEYGLYRDYADFLEKTGRHGEALTMRREVIRLARIFGLFTHLPVEQSKLAILLMLVGDSTGAGELADSVRAQIKGGRLPKSILAEINANLARLGNMSGASIAKAGEKEAIDLQPQKSIVIPLADRPWTTYLTLTNSGKLAKKGLLRIQGQAVECSLNEETDDITIKILAPKEAPAPTELACSVEPGTYRLIHVQAGAEMKVDGEVRIDWKDAESSSSASLALETAEAGVSGAIIQAGDYRANPFYGVSMYLQYVSKEAVPGSPPLRFICSQPARVEVYQLDETPLAIDARGNGSLLDQGDELFVQSDGKGNVILPLSNGQASISLRVYPEKGIPEEGLTVDIEAFISGSWQKHSSNRLAK